MLEEKSEYGYYKNYIVYQLYRGNMSWEEGWIADNVENQPTYGAVMRVWQHYNPVMMITIKSSSSRTTTLDLDDVFEIGNRFDDFGPSSKIQKFTYHARKMTVGDVIGDPQRNIRFYMAQKKGRPTTKSGVEFHEMVPTTAE
jgi:hypothetical protein